MSIRDLTELTDASAVTIRRDLRDLEGSGSVARTRGGATRPAARGTLMPFALRYDTDRDLKAALGVRAAHLIEDGESLILDNGTTCFAVAEALVGRSVTALSLSLRSAAVLASHPSATVLVPGGPVETDSLALVSAHAVMAVREMRVDAVVLGACSAAPAHGLTSTSYDDAVIKRACIRSATRRILVATPEKLQRTSSFHFADVEEITHLVTSGDAADDSVAEFRAAGVEIHLV